MPTLRDIKSLFRWVGPVASARALGRQTRDTAGAIRALASDALASNKADAALVGIGGEAERFRAATRGMTKVQLERAETNLANRQTATGIMAILAVGLAVLAPQLGFAQGAIFPALNILLPWLFAAWVLTHHALASLRLLQIRRRTMVGWRALLQDPAALLGAMPPRKSIAPLLVVLALLGGNPVMAQGDWSTVPVQTVVPNAMSTTAPSNVIGAITSAVQNAGSDDLALQWLSRAFPGMSVMGTGRPASPGTDALAPLMHLLNTVLLCIGTGILLWHTVVATVHAAHTGKSFTDNSRYHGFWAPIRILFGFVMLAPISGYSMAQYATLNALALGSGLANKASDTLVQTLLSPTSGAVAVAPVLEPGRNLAARVLQSEVCAVTLQAAEDGRRFWQRAILGGRVTVQLPNARGVEIVTARVWDYGPVCGVFKLERSAQNAASAAENTAATRFEIERDAAFGRLVQGVRDSLLGQAMAQRVTPGWAGQDVPDTMIAGRVTAMRQAGVEYEQALNRASKTFAESLDADGRARFSAEVSRLGWTSLGGLHFALTRASHAAAQKAASGYPEGVGPEPTRAGGETTQRINTALAAASLLLSDAEARDYVSNVGSGLVENRSASSPIGWLVRGPSHDIARGVADAARLDVANPMASMQRLGQTTLVAGQALYTALGVAMVTTGATDDTASSASIVGAPARPVTSAAHRAVEWAGKILFPLAILLMVFGIVHGYVLPLTVYIMWLLAVVSCMIFSIQAVVAAPFAALQHIRADGDDFVGDRQRPFWVLVFNAAFRPFLLVVGLLMSTLLFSLTAQFLNATWATAMSAAMGDTVIGLFGQVTMLGILLYLHVQLAVRSMSLITQLPEMVSRLVGADDGARGEHEASNQIWAGMLNTTINRGPQAIVAAMPTGAKEKTPASRPKVTPQGPAKPE